MTIEEEKLLEEFSAAFKKAIMKVSQEELMCFLEATNYHELNKLDVRVIPEFSSSVDSKTQSMSN